MITPRQILRQLLGQRDPGEIAGPGGRIYYERDPNGYPRIQARDLLDGTFARGYLHALDRTVQLHLSLMTARGRLMELLGDRPFVRTLDRATRALNLGGDLDAQVAAMRDDTRALLQAYCDGFNAGSAARPRPLVLRLLKIPTETLTPATLVLLYRFFSYFGLTSQQHVAETLVTELVAGGAPGDALEMLLGEEQESHAQRQLRSLSGLQLDELFVVMAPAGPGGSNAFAVSRERSATGGALLMSEFHMEIGRFPPVVYAVHVDYDDGDYYQGMGLPGVAWQSAGRTSRVAWTYTFGHGDNFDIVLERCKDGRYQAGKEWRELSRRTEEVQIRGREQPERWVYYDSDFGTVVGDASGEGIFPCIRWSGLREVHRDFDAARSMFDAASVEELVEQQREIRSFALCAVVADASGAVAQVHTGQVDRRPRGWTGLCPYPGWELSERTVDPDLERARPLEINPQDGLLVTANELAEGPKGERWTPLPEPRYRRDRLREVLAASDRVGLAEMVRASYDAVDLCAARLMAIWGPLLPQTREAAELRMWASSRGPSGSAHGRRMIGLFHALHHEAVRALLAPRLGDALTRRIFDELGLMMSFQHHLDDVLLLRKPHLLDEQGLRRVLAQAWPAAMRRVRRGRHGVPVRAKFKNVLTEGREPGFLGLSTGMLDLPGTPTAPFQMRMVEFDGMRMVGGPVFHMLFDMSRPGGWYNMAGGASESPLGPGYGAGLDDWLEGRFLPLGHPEGDPPRLRS